VLAEQLDSGRVSSVSSQSTDAHTQVGRIPENILSKITAKILRGLWFLHRNKHMVGGWV
jgi:hypothetical protein